MTGGYDPCDVPGMGNEDWDFWLHCFLKNAIFLLLGSSLASITGVTEQFNVSLLTTMPAFEVPKQKVYL